MNIDEILDLDPYALPHREKQAMLQERLQELTLHHYLHCPEYRAMMNAIGLDTTHLPAYDALPFLPVRLFKEWELCSCPKTEIVKTMTSSGTTGQQVSRIFLDRATAAAQQKCLTRIVSQFIGNKRVPMLILDTPAVIKDRNMFSARGAGILGFSMFGSKRCYAFDENMELDTESVRTFLSTHEGETIFMFGFTFMVWQHFYQKLATAGYHPDLHRAVLIHGGGWKKLIGEKVSPEVFKAALHDVCGILPENIHDYYGMVEQTGTVYVECACGHLHASSFSDVIIRRPRDFSIADTGEKGLVEVVSVLPESYPGHILLTEDEGRILGEDDCPCGRKGKYFTIEGRIKHAEIRGCSDTYASKF
ncbi:MAG: acyl-protein synthetase [Bacteroidales bacterium]|nr:acyl-protein synthetase [Bacteroidales bacterium]